MKYTGGILVYVEEVGLNETAKMGARRSQIARIHLGDRCFVYDGELGELVKHTLGMVFVLVGVDGCFEIGWGAGAERPRVALVPPSCAHTLLFVGRVIAVCVYPHHPLYALFVRMTEEGPCCVERWGEVWECAVERWDRGEELGGLWDAVLGDVWVPGGVEMDERIEATVRGFACGVGLDESAQELGRRVGLSTSRFTHLFRREVGAGIRRVRLGYRMRDVARRVRGGEDFTRAAHAAGFADSAHLSRSFRGILGLSPSHAMRGLIEWGSLEASQETVYV